MILRFLSEVLDRNPSKSSWMLLVTISNENLLKDFEDYPKIVFQV
jgi:hypothetical protein